MNMSAAKNQDELKKDKSLSAMVYNTLKDKIIKGELLPGSVMMERTLAEEFKISRTPVREALKLLLQEGWIIWEERRKAVVSEIKESDVIELFKLRDMIEHFAIKDIITNGEPQVLAGLLVPIANEMERLKDLPNEFMKKDMEFHSAIVDKLGITKLAPLWSKIYDDMMRLDVQSIYPKRSPEDIVAEHRRLINAFWNGDVNEALSCISDHCEQILKVYQLKHPSKSRTA